jgi:2-amino-4-hydroxy-6-hydroxymethyldihydropteridine diphosphokinase
VDRVFVLLGSNVDKERNLPAAVALLRPHGLVAVSAAYETAPVGTRDGAPFLNAAAELRTALSPADFKREVCGAIERALGRVRDPRDRFAPRTIDLDIALWSDAVADPDLLRHLHAALPLAELAPDLRHPIDGRTLAAIAADLAAASPPAGYPRRRPDVILSVRS